MKVTIIHTHIGLACNIKKRKCIVVNPLDRTKIVSKYFPQFSINGQPVQFADEFRYLGHIITSYLCDDIDINHEIHNACAN